jgi:hypothetical protein
MSGKAAAMNNGTDAGIVTPANDSESFAYQGDMQEVYT